MNNTAYALDAMARTFASHWLEKCEFTKQNNDYVAFSKTLMPFMQELTGIKSNVWVLASTKEIVNALIDVYNNASHNEDICLISTEYYQKVSDLLEQI